MDRKSFLRELMSKGVKDPKKLKKAVEIYHQSNGLFDDEVSFSTPVGVVAKESESGGRPETVSTGVGDYGGKSYGAYQLSTNVGSLDSFLKSTPYGQSFAGLQPGSVEFDNKWKEMSIQPEFNKAQEEHILKTNINSVYSHLKDTYNIDANKSPAVRELLISTGNQYGPRLAKKVFDRALLNKAKGMTEQQFIDELTNYKLGTIDQYFSGSSQTVRDGIKLRFEKERKQYYNIINKTEEERRKAKEALLSEQPVEEPIQKEDPSFGGTLKRMGAQTLKIIAGIPRGLTAPDVLEAQSLIDIKTKELQNPDIDPTKKEKLNKEIIGLNKFVSNIQKNFGDNKLNKFADDILKTTSSIKEKYPTAGDALKQKGIAGLSEYAAHTIIENAGVTLAILGSSFVPGLRQAAIPAVGVGSAGEKLTDLEQREADGELKMTDIAKYYNAIGTGAAEAIPEMFGTGLIVKTLQKNFAKTAAKEGAATAKELLKPTVKSIVTSGLKGWGLEFSDENITSISEKIINRVTKEDTDPTTLKKEIYEYLVNDIPDLAISTVTGGGLSATSEAIRKPSTNTLEEKTTNKEPELDVSTIVVDQYKNSDAASREFYRENYKEIPSLIQKFDQIEASEVAQSVPDATTQQETPIESTITPEPTSKVPKPVKKDLKVVPEAKEPVVEKDDKAILLESLKTKGIESLEDFNVLDASHKNEIIKRLNDDAFDAYSRLKTSEKKSIVPPVHEDEGNFGDVEETPMSEEAAEELIDIENKTIDSKIAIWKQKHTPEQVKHLIELETERLNQLLPPKNRVDDFTVEELEQMVNGGHIDLVQKVRKEAEGSGRVDVPRSGEEDIVVKKEPEVKEPTKEVIPKTKPTPVVEKQPIVTPTVTPPVKKEEPPKEEVKVEPVQVKEEPKETPLPPPPVEEESKLPEDFFTYKTRDNTGKMIDKKRSVEEQETRFFHRDKGFVKVDKNNPAEASTYGKKARKAVRVALTSSNPRLAINSLVGKTYKELADIADRAHVANKGQIETTESDTEKQKSRDEVLNKIAGGTVEYTPEIEQQLKDALKTEKMSDNEIQKKIEKVFEIISVGTSNKKAEREASKKAVEKGIKPGTDEFTSFISKELAQTTQSKKYISVKDPAIFEELRGGSTEILSFEETPNRRNKPDLEDEEIKDIDLENYNEEETSFARAKGDLAVDRVTSKFVEGHTEEIRKLFKNLSDDQMPTITVSTKYRTKNGTVKEILTDKDYGATMFDDNGQPVIVIHPRIPVQEIGPTIFHELVGHLGFSRVVEGIDIKLGQLATDLYQKDYDSEFSQKIRNNYSKIYDNDPIRLRDEWFAQRTEELYKTYFDANGLFKEDVYNADKSILKKVYDFIQNVVEKMFKPWFRQDATEEEIQNLTKAVIQKLSDVRDFGGGKQVAYAKAKVKPTLERKAQVKLDRLKKNVEDRAKLIATKETASAAGVANYKDRFHDYVTSLLHKEVAGSSVSSARKQLYDKILQIKEVGDVANQEALEMAKEFSSWQDATVAFNEVDKFERRNKTRLNTKGIEEIKNIQSILDSLHEKEKTFTRYVTLKRLQDRGGVNTGGEGTESSDRYKDLIENGWVKRESITVEENKVPKQIEKYFITEEGKKQISSLKEELTDPKTNMMFDAQNTHYQLNAAKELLNTVRTQEKALKLEKQNKKDVLAQKAIEQISKIEVKNGQFKTSKDIINKQANSLRHKFWSFLKFAKHFSLDNFQTITHYLDDLNRGAFTEMYTELKKGQDKERDYRHVMNDVLINDLKHINGMSEKESRKLLMKFSPSFRYGFVESIGKAAGVIKPDLIKWKVTDSNGKQQEVELTRDQRVAEYISSLNEEYRDIVLKHGMKLKQSDPETFKPTEKEYFDLLQSITPEEKYVADALIRHFQRQSVEINKVSMRDVGRALATEDFYFPRLRYSKQVKSTWKEEPIMGLDKDGKPVGQFYNEMGGISPQSLKERSKSDAPIIREGAFEAVGRVSPMIEKYIGLALPSKRIYSILNSIADEMQKKGLEPEYNELKHQLERITMPKVSNSPLDKFMYMFDSYYIPAKLGINLPVALMQPTAAIMYYTQAPLKSRTPMQFASALAKGLNPNTVNSIMSRAKKQDNFWVERSDGFMATDLLESGISSAAREKAGMGHHGIRKVFSNEMAMKPLTWGDQINTAIIWLMAEKDIAIEHPELKVGSDVFDKMVSDKVRDVVQTTQPTFDQLDRSRMFTYALARPLTYFTSSVVKMGQVQVTGLHKIEKGVRTGNNDLIAGGMFDVLMTTFIQGFAISALTLGWKVLKGDKEPEDYKDVSLWTKEAFRNLVSMGGSLSIGLANLTSPTSQTPPGLFHIYSKLQALVSHITAQAKEGYFDTETNLKNLKELSKDFTWMPRVYDDIVKIVTNMKREYSNEE